LIQFAKLKIRSRSIYRRVYSYS